MEPRRAILLGILILASCCFANRTSAQLELTPSNLVDHALIFMDFPEALGTVDRQQVRLCLSLLVQRLKLPEKNLPHVFVIHASPEAAHAAAVGDSTVRRNSSGQEMYYEFWIVGQPHPDDYAGALYSILEQHFALKVEAPERKDIARFVHRFMAATVSARKPNP